METDTLIILGVGALLLLLTVVPYVRRMRRLEESNRQRLEVSEAAGLNEPPTLHPVVDPLVCLGSGACVSACPEGDILGFIDGRPVLINASRCVGHGLCAAACPVEAISLVFGTARRGVDIPHVQGNFETNVPGIYIVGELGGMGLIRNALRQGRQAVEGISREEGRTSEGALDLLIVGAGPAGIAAGLTAMQAGLRFALIEQEEPGGAVRHYPRQKVVMTERMEIPLYGRVEWKEASKEQLLALWEEVFAQTGLEVRTGERLLAVEREGELLKATTSVGGHRTQRLVLAVGRRGTPRRLGVPGEELEKVAYRLLEPEKFSDSRILVVGGGNSALEAAWALARRGINNEITLVHRDIAFPRASEANRERIEALRAEGGLQVFFGAQVEEIREEEVRLEVAGEKRELANDQIFICIGGQLPLELLSRIGVAVERKFGEA